MESIEFSFNYSEYNSPEQLDQTESHLIRKARAIAKKAWAPYSGFMVGAAVLLENGEIITGNNQENAAYPSGLCAERTAVFYANSIFPEVPVKCIAIAAFSKGKYLDLPVAPCGSCRQVLLETQNRFNNKMIILLSGESKILRIEDVSCLLPFPFEGF